MYHPPNNPWRGPPSHGATVTVLTAAAPPGTIPQDLQHLRRPGPRDRVGHLGGTDQRLWPNDSDGDQDIWPDLLLQQAGIRRGVLADDCKGGWRRAGWSGPGRLEPTPGLELRVNALPRAELVDLKGYHQQKTDHNHWRLPPSFHPGALTRLGGGPDTLPGPRSHIVRWPQRQHQPSPELT